MKSLGKILGLLLLGILLILAALGFDDPYATN